MDSITLNFQNAGFENNMVVANLGFMFILFAGHFVLVPIALLMVFIGKCCPKFRPISNKVNRYVFWSGSMRFFMEGYLDFCLCSLMNLKNLDWGDQFIAVTACNYVAIFITVLVCIFPFFVLIWYLCRMHLWHTNEFQ